MVGATGSSPGATVIDVGINRTDDGLLGDVDFDAAAEVAGAITPVPGGVGPMTIACLLRNTLQARAAMAVGVSTAALGRADRGRRRRRRCSSRCSSLVRLELRRGVIATSASSARAAPAAGRRSAGSLIVVLLVVIGCAAWLARRRRRGPCASPSRPRVLTATVGHRSPSLALALRALVFQPGPDELVGPALRGLARPARRARSSPSAAGGRSDERTDAPESAYDRRPSRARPPPPPPRLSGPHDRP